jgi:hypothetical protein
VLKSPTTPWSTAILAVWRAPNAFGAVALGSTGSPQRVRPLADWEPGSLCSGLRISFSTALMDFKDCKGRRDLAGIFRAG